MNDVFLMKSLCKINCELCTLCLNDIHIPGVMSYLDTKCLLQGMMYSVMHLNIVRERLHPMHSH